MRIQKRHRVSYALCLLVMFVPVPLWGQAESPIFTDDLPEALQWQLTPKTFKPILPPKKKGLLSTEEWRQRIDETWGMGTRTTEQRLAIFDTAWETIDADFACFQDLGLDWQSIYDKYRPEIEAGVSRGRFAAIMNHMVLPLKESHTKILDQVVNLQTFFSAGTPLFFVGGWGLTSHFGAAVTPLPDKSLLVYAAVENHPLGLVPGDIVLGYEGVPWHELYPALLAAELPLTGSWWGSSPSSYEHSMLISVGMNWHLFDTIDIRKFETGETVQLSTSAFTGPYTRIFSSEQLPIPGIEHDPSTQINNQTPVRWGVVEGTNVGYIYVWGWFGTVESLFEAAVTDLVLEQEVDGLILDFRLNFGGNMFLSNPALAILFNKQVETVGFHVRDNPDDHVSFAQAGFTTSYDIFGAPDTFFNKPIAVLVGPGALSSGDQVALRMKFHPRSRFFGKSTSTAFNSPTAINLDGSFRLRYANADAFLVSNPGVNLTHDELEVDEAVWLTPEDVAVGKDTVVEAALAWITKENDACDSSRIISHVTSANGGFATDVLVTNNTTTEKRVVLAPFDISGLPLTEVELFLPGNSTVQHQSHALFNDEAVSHFRVCAPDTVVVSVSYQTAAIDGGSAHVHESTEARTSFRIYPGPWDFVFDGMALVNLGDQETTVRARLLDYTGAEVSTVTVNEALPSMAKQLTVFETLFENAGNHIIEIETDQPASVVFLRGTRGGVTPSYLFQNNAVPDPVLQASSKRITDAKQ